MNKLLVFAILCFGFLHAKDGKIRFLRDSGDPENKTEIFMQKANGMKAPLLMILHGAGAENGVRSIAADQFEYWIERGYSVAAISMPGYGRSRGERDFCGPDTLSILNQAIDALKRRFNVENYGIIGFGLGGTAALLLASQRSDISCIIATNFCCDLLRHLDLKDPLVETLLAKNYAISIDEESFRVRSALAHVETINTPMFLLHRKDSPIFNENEVVDFANALQNRGVECRYSFLEKKPVDEQKISHEEFIFETCNWVDAHMKG